MEPLFVGAAVLWLVLNGTAIWAFGGKWRTAALIPAAAMALAIAVAVFGILGGSNLAPIWVVFALPLCLAWILALWVVKAAAWVLMR
ncbi:MAG: hypothetical protein WBA88_07975 [Pseudaminobacter sp.]